MKTIAFAITMLFFAGLSSPGQTANPPAQPLHIDAVTGVNHLLSKPELSYPEEAQQQHIEGKVELELTVSPQGEVVSEQVISGPLALRQASTDAFKKVKYSPFLRNLEPSIALVRVIVAYEKDQVAISTKSEHTSEESTIRNGLKRYDASVTAGSAIQEATRAAAGKPGGNLEILSDTQGVDFGPYLQGVLHDVRQNWYNSIPESLRMKHGNVIIEFAITNDGKVAGMKLVTSSGDIPLDRAAWAGIVNSAFHPLPSEFKGPYLALRFRFFYNPTKEELTPTNSTAPASAIK